MTARGKRPASAKAGPAGIGRGQIIILSIMAVVARFWLGDPTYLTLAHLAGGASGFWPSPGCSQVLGSAYASVGRIPTAGFGVIAYFVVFSCAICAAFGYRSARLVLNGTVAIMFLATLGFLYLQAFVIHAFCPFCLLSAAVTF